jgi:predicted kinase
MITIQTAAITTPTAPVAPSDRPRPLAVFLYGAPASGKSAVTDPLEAKGLECISADKFCTEEDLIDPSARHQERKHLARLQNLQALKEGRPFLLEGLGGNPVSMAAKIEEARSYGFTVEVQLIWCHWTLNFQRNLRRKRTLNEALIWEALREIGPSWSATFSLADTWGTTCTNPQGNPYWAP